MKARDQRSSFGIPEDMKQAASKFKEEKTKVTEITEEPSPSTEPEANLDKAVEDASPEKILADMGIEFNDDDLQHLIFKGFIEKEVEIIKGKFKATLKTLTGDEYDLADEMVANELNTLNMTKDGMRARYSQWIMVFGITKLNGKILSKGVLDKEGKYDVEATAEEKRNVLGALSAAVTNLLIEKHTQFNLAVTQIIRDPGKHSKN